MNFTFTPKASRKILGILSEKGGKLALRIRVRRVLGRHEWQMVFEPLGPDAILVDGVPVAVDASARTHLDGIVIDWVVTPDGPGFGVYDRNLIREDLRMSAD